MQRMQEQSWQAVDVPEEGGAISFKLHMAGAQEEGFVIRFSGKLYAYLNRCPHNGSPLDWVPGRFFSEDGDVLFCQTHGAMFAPDSGICLAGPCPRGLTPLPIREEGESLFVPSALER
jgi:nitrite reductase/ring-hydroxylating ferredoxin subunit